MYNVTCPCDFSFFSRLPPYSRSPSSCPNSATPSSLPERLSRCRWKRSTARYAFFPCAARVWCSIRLSDLLKLDPSLDLAERAPDGVQGDLSIRGAGFGKTLVLLNGMRINDPQSGHHNLDIPVPLESVDRVEVMRGSGSTLYGADAVGGVINIITAPPSVTEFRLRTAFGSDGINQQRASLGIAGKKVSEQLSFARDFSTGFRPTAIIAIWQFASVTRLATDFGNGSVNLAYMDHPFGADQFYGNFNSWEDTKTWFAGVQQALGAKTQRQFLLPPP